MSTAEALLHQAAEAIRAERQQLERDRAEVAAGMELLSESYLAQLAERVGIDTGIQRERLRCLALVEQQIQMLKPTGVAIITLRHLLHYISGGDEFTTTTGEHHG
jgi:hypothetical protein